MIKCGPVLLIMLVNSHSFVVKPVGLVLVAVFESGVAGLFLALLIVSLKKGEMKHLEDFLVFK